MLRKYASEVEVVSEGGLGDVTSVTEVGGGRGAESSSDSMPRSHSTSIGEVQLAERLGIPKEMEDAKSPLSSAGMSTSVVSRRRLASESRRTDKLTLLQLPDIDKDRWQVGTEPGSSVSVDNTIDRESTKSLGSSSEIPICVCRRRLVSVSIRSDKLTLLLQLLDRGKVAMPSQTRGSKSSLELQPLDDIMMEGEDTKSASSSSEKSA